MQIRQPVVRSRLEYRALGLGLTLGLTPLCLPLLAWAQEASGAVESRAFPAIGSRVAVWMAAQLHLYFAACVLGCRFSP
jgi:hypothetical protein